jgi:hypothetical protein
VRGDDGRPYAVEHDGPAVAHAVRGRDGLRTPLASLYYETYQKVPGGSGLTDALTVLEGQARRSDPVPVGLRVASAGDGRVALDLGGEEGGCVVVDAAGWRVALRSPVLFRRSALTDPLPVPARGGSLDDLRGHLNVDEARGGSSSGGSLPPCCLTCRTLCWPSPASRGPPSRLPPASSPASSTVAGAVVHSATRDALVNLPSTAVCSSSSQTDPLEVERSATRSVRHRAAPTCRPPGRSAGDRPHGQRHTYPVLLA